MNIVTGYTICSKNTHDNYLCRPIIIQESCDECCLFHITHHLVKQEFEHVFLEFGHVELTMVDVKVVMILNFDINKKHYRMPLQ